LATVKKQNKTSRVKVNPTAPPARSPENRENQLIEKAYQLAEERLNDGSASAQEIVHFLRLGTAKAALEKEKLEAETNLIKAKQETVESTKRSEEKYQEALDAFRLYNGQANSDDQEL